MDNVLIVNIKINLNESPLDCKEIKPVNPEGNQSWIFTGRTNDETPILWPPDVKNWLIGKDPDAGKDWRQGEKGTTEDEMVGWHCQLDGHEFEQAPGVGNGQGSLMCCRPWGCKESEMTEQLNWTELRNLYAGQEVTVITEHETMHWFKIGEGAHQDYIVTLVILLTCKVLHAKCQARWITSWNQVCWEK